jgi:hypothetical protein
MAITIQNIIEEAYAKHGSSPDAAELQTGLTLANNFIFSINTEFALDTPISEYTALTDSFALGDNWRRALIASLAYDLGENLDSKTIETLYKTAEEEKFLLKRTYLKLITDADMTDCKELLYAVFMKLGKQIPNTDELNDGLIAVNNLITSWNEEFALDTPIVEFATLATTFSSLSLGDEWKRALLTNVSLDLAETWQAQPTETLVFAARETKAIILRANARYVTDGDVSTSKELLISAFRKIGVVTPTTNELNQGLSICNNIIQTWNKEFGLDTPIVEFTDLTTTLAAISMGDEWKRPLIFATAVDLAFDYNLEAKIQLLQPFALENKLLLKNLNSRFVSDFEADTVKEILVTAFRMAGKPNPDTAELNHALSRMNNMIATWATEFSITYTETFTSLADSIATYPLHWREPLEYNMAVKIAESFPGTQIAPTIFAEARKLRRELDIKELVDINDSRLDDMLDPLYNKGGEATDINITET